MLFAYKVVFNLKGNQSVAELGKVAPRNLRRHDHLGTRKRMVPLLMLTFLVTPNATLTTMENLRFVRTRT